MAIEFGCTKCGTTLRVPDEHLGKKARCPKCQELILVTASSPTPSEPQSASFSSAPQVDNPYTIGQGSVLPSGGVSGRSYQNAHRGGMILALGIMAIVCNIAGVPGFLAWLLGRADIKQMDEGRMDPEGRGITQAGMIMGMVMSILFLVGIAFTICYLIFVVVIVAGAAAGGM